MAESLKIEDLGAAIAQELTIYHKEVTEKVTAAGAKAANKLKRLTKASAPVRTGAFRNSIAIAVVEHPVTKMKTYIWHAGAPHHRLTHLLVNGHATRNGGRVPGDPFLSTAVDLVLPEYKKDIEEALKG